METLENIQVPLFKDLDNYEKFLILRNRIGVLDKELAVMLGVSTRTITERVTGRSEKGPKKTGIKNETILAMRFILDNR